jgi:carbon-monoxide dehydrogenase medium subunit
VIPTAFDYQRATSVEDALARLQASEGAKLIAGGHSLVPLMKLRLSEPTLLVDVARIPGLAGIREVDGQIEIGAATTHHDVAVSPLLADRCPVLSETATEIGDPQVRNRGTLGGSLAHADPAADYPAAMLALDAEILLRNPRGPRTVKASDFFKGLFAIDLSTDEMIVGVRVRPIRAASYTKLHQRASHFAIVGVAAAVEVAGGTIRWARLGLTGAGTHAVRLTAVEQALAGRAASRETLEAASVMATLDEVNADIHASEEYRRAMIPVFTRRALEGALARA